MFYCLLFVWLFQILRMNYPTSLLKVRYRTITNLRKFGRRCISKWFTSYSEAPEVIKAIISELRKRFNLTSDDWIKLYRVSQEECTKLRESIPYVKVYRYNPNHLCPKLNGYGDNGQRKVRSSCGSTCCTCSADALRVHQNALSAKLNQYFNTAGYSCAM